ncbi:MAG TPA: carbohydrate ABC transporter permease [Thermotogota bacterium]|nr:carbohydrate ABC transporter permease [Thermotogota bacterium]HRW92994.1 carbohydrate ABC transporter permease [Thermotogota bacterium]
MNRKPRLPVRIVVYLLVLLVAVLINLPFFWMLVTSFKTEDEVFKLPPSFLPTIFDMRNYVGAFDLIPLGRYVVNTLIVALSVTGLQLVFNSFAAYGLARVKFKGANIVFMILIGTLMVPPEVTMVPLYVIIKNFGMIDSYRALIIPFMSSAFGIFLLRQFFLGIPKELEEAAIIDGAGHMKIFFQIILPLSKPALYTMALYTFLAHWNEYMWPLIVINSAEKQMIQVGISQFVSGWETQWTLRMAASTVAVIPIIVFFFFVQKQFVEGISISGLKE